MTPTLDGRHEYSRPNTRFLVFGLAAILAIGGLTTRLFYLQIVNGGQYSELSQGNRTAVVAIPSARGLIYDRNGVTLVKNVPTFAVKIRPVDLPDDLIGKSGVEASYESQLRGTYGSKTVEKDASGREVQDLQVVADAQSGDSLHLTIDTKEQANAQKALQWGMRAAGLKRGAV